MQVRKGVFVEDRGADRLGGWGRCGTKENCSALTLHGHPTGFNGLLATHVNLWMHRLTLGLLH